MLQVRKSGAPGQDTTPRHPLRPNQSWQRVRVAIGVAGVNFQFAEVTMTVVSFRPGKSATVAYLEQTLSEMITNALTAVDGHRTMLLHPNLSISGSLKAFVALHLKAHNASSPPHIRERAERRLSQFLEECSIADKIRSSAPRGSAVSAARLSPRLPDVSQLGEQFDKLRSEPKQYLLERFLRPDPVATK